MEDFVPFASGAYFVVLGVLLFGRGMDMLSTWVATPTLALEGNPLVKKMGWRWSLLLNVAFVGGFALWPLVGIVISTTSLLVAARNFQQAWLMRSLGEEAYRGWMVERVRETPISLYLFCLLGQTLMPGLVGGALMYFGSEELVPMGVGLGIVCYAIAVGFFSTLSVWRIRRALG